MSENFATPEERGAGRGRGNENWFSIAFSGHGVNVAAGCNKVSAERWRGAPGFEGAMIRQRRPPVNGLVTD
jgi:hypothetical protein